MSQTNVRQPDLMVLVNGAPLPGVYEAEVQSNAYLSADRFSVRAALTAIDGATWATLPIRIEVQVGIDGAWQSLVAGPADTLQIDPIRGDIYTTGRDMTSVFVAAQTGESFENLTSSDVAILFAGRHGMSMSVTPTATLIGRYYQNGHTRSALSQHGRATTEWDVLSWLAQQEGYDVWVGGNILYFQPPTDYEQSSTVSPLDCIAMQLSRDLAVGAGFTVEVHSWDCASQQAVVAQSSYGTLGANTTNLIALRPNLAIADAQILAQRTAWQLGSHERTLSYEMPADIATMPRTLIELIATNTDFDGTYRVYEVERRFSMRHGFTQRVEARRSSWTIS